MVDDDLDVCDVVDMILMDFGYEIKAVSDQAHALDARSWLPDVVLLDLTVPGVDSTDLLRKFRELRSLRPAIVVFSAGVNAQSVATDIGADGFLEKPFELDFFVKTVDEIMARRQAWRQELPSACRSVAIDLESAPQIEGALL